MDSLVIGSSIGALVGIIVTVAVVLVIKQITQAKKLQAATSESARILNDAEEQKKRMLLEAKEEALRSKQEIEADARDRRRELQRAESRLQTREENLDTRQDSLEIRESKISDRETTLEEAFTELEDLKTEQVSKLEEVANLSMAEAKDQVMQTAEATMEQEIAKRYYSLEQKMHSDVDEKAKKIIALSIQRLAADVVNESTTSLVSLPSDDMKGRLIGREGRNIRAIEAATGVDLIIDDTPEAVTVSCFDPIRREVAKIALTNLIADGRIHPTRIEETVTKAQKEVEDNIVRCGEQAVLDAAVRGLNPELIKLIGRLQYRYSYGENILQHSVEVSRIAGMLAGEVNADIQIAKAGGLLHDIGKALTHEVEGTHVELGEEVARRYNLPPAVAAAINEHHEDDRGSAEAFIVAAADAISAARPGSRRDTVELYLKRLEALEDVANSFDGVQKSFAIQAGREVRILVQPDEIDDIEASDLARKVVKKIEENLVYPGEIMVTVVRETRTTEVAH
ncbi:MAG: ribonuclease Y [Chloroflexi bacterium]|nr:ribonuclease Y [Chloroflexota bacterium]MQF86904.1 ribonuclease Y [SAR202 cluster bacterium]|tara:strand:+ start:15811 stop:17343 length:1533 start_codon:yes stop_codon:yes gene_type:complete